MKRLSALVIIALLIGFVYTQSARSTTDQTTGSMSADKPVHGAAPGKDANGVTQPDEDKSESVGDAAKRYWNKFIDVLAGPAS